MSPLKTRILTASLLVPAMLALVLWAKLWVFSLISALVIGLAAFEWTRLAGFKSLKVRLLALTSMCLIILIALSLISYFSGLSYDPWTFFETTQTLINVSVCVFWLMASVAVSLYPRWTSHNKYLNLIIGIWVLLPAWFYANLLRAVSPYWLLYPIILVCSADTAAYFIGRKWGRHTLNPQLSPGKTWEGVLAAGFAAVLVASIGFFALKVRISFLSWLLLSVMTVLISIVGDLFESLFKRQQNLKDSGVLLPGHGGLMDRLDSLTAAIPIFGMIFVF